MEMVSTNLSLRYEKVFQHAESMVMATDYFFIPAKIAT